MVSKYLKKARQCVFLWRIIRAILNNGAFTKVRLCNITHYKHERWHIAPVTQLPADEQNMSAVQIGVLGRSLSPLPFFLAFDHRHVSCNKNLHTLWLWCTMIRPSPKEMLDVFWVEKKHTFYPPFSKALLLVPLKYYYYSKIVGVRMGETCQIFVKI